MRTKGLKNISAVLLLSILLITCMLFSGCSKRPEISEIRDRIIYLVEGSKQVNEIFFGVGVPVYIRDSQIAEEKFVYVGNSYAGYEKSNENSPYITIDEMKAEAQQIYSSAYCEELFAVYFEGIVHDGYTVIEYTEMGEGLYQVKDKEPLVREERIYLYNTMEFTRPSNGEYINIKIQSYQESTPDIIVEEHLSFALEDGNWYLDTPTY